MKIKNNKLMIYKVDKEYLYYLSKIDKNVRQKYERKYYGILITKDDMDYCIPFTSKIKSRNKKLTINIKDNNSNEIIAQLTLNNMIPVKAKVIELVDVNLEKDKDYLNKELRYLRHEDVKKAILEKTENLFNVLHNKNHPDYKFFKQLCTNFEILEQECIKWNSTNNV